MRKQPRETAITIAARAALRVAPLVGRASRQLGDSTGATFRAIALARVAGKYPARASELRTDAAATYNAAFAAASEDDAAYAAFAAADTAAAAAAAYADAAAVAFAAASAVHHAADAARAVDTGYDALWVEVRADAYAVAGDDASAVADMQLWSGTRPEWARVAWDKLVAALLIDEDWDVWIDWYEERLDGGSRGEAYEVVFASVPREEWDKGPAAANAWIKGHLPREESLEVGDGFSLEAWLSAQNRETAIAIAVRAALRVAPLAARIARKGMGLQQQRELTHVAAVIFRALASAHVSVHDPDRTFISSALNAAGASADLSVVAIVAEVARAAMFATSAAANSAAAAAAANPNAPRSAAAAVRAFVDAFVSADLSASDADTAAWNEILSDIEATQRDGVLALLEAPLWRQREPGWVRPALDILEAELPGDEGWDVWFDWYKQRLRGGSRGDDFELVFASVPLDVWDSGPAAANVWIREHLPRLPIDELHAKPVISDKELLEAWLSGQSREAAIAIAARAALRVAPLAVRLSRNHQSVEAFEDVATLASAIFRSCASARVGARYPVRITEFRKAAYVVASRAEGSVDLHGRLGARCRVRRFLCCIRCLRRFRCLRREYCVRDRLVTTAAAAASKADARDPAASIDAMWEEVRVDAASIEGSRVNPLSDLPLWSNGAPEWGSLAWSSLQEALPDGENWEVWTDWYNERLRGVSRGEDYELVFASVPIDVWDKGPAAANAWIKARLASLRRLRTAEVQRLELEVEVQRLKLELEANLRKLELEALPSNGDLNSSRKRRTFRLAHEIESLKGKLHRAQENARAEGLPEPVPNVELPWTYGWTAKVTLGIIAGPESFPFTRSSTASRSTVGPWKCAGSGQKNCGETSGWTVSQCPTRVSGTPGGLPPKPTDYRWRG